MRPSGPCASGRPIQRCNASTTLLTEQRAAMSAYRKQLRRSIADRQIAGVCGGIGEYLDLDPTAVRVGYVLLSLLTAFAGCLVYVVLWVVIPEREYY